jgi:ribosomal protein L13
VLPDWCHVTTPTAAIDWSVGSESLPKATLLCLGARTLVTMIVLARRSQSSPGGATAGHTRTATHSVAPAACSLYIQHPEVTLLYRYIIDAEGQTLGRLASLVARYIRGKNLPTYSPSMDMGSMIIVINAGKVKVGGRKTDDKLYKRHVNGLPGSMKVETFRQLQARVPERIIEKAVWGMLPKGRLGRRIKLNLKVRLCAAAYLRTWQACGLCPCHRCNRHSMARAKSSAR